MLLPLYGMMVIEKKFPKLAKSKIGSPATQVALVGLGLLIGNPLTCALFQQKSPIETSKLEEEFHHYNQTVYFNKGL